jgi:rSAM/selenodomain-associated transferase 1
MSPTHRTLIVFGREPRPGRVKTRLIPALGPEGAAALYARLLGQTLKAASQLLGCSRQLWLDDLDRDSVVARNAESLGFELHAQIDSDLGARMGQAFSAALDQPGQAVLIGSDCPGYTPDYLESAFAALQKHDAVIGPAADGGYVLLGLREMSARVFDGIPWSTKSVLATTRDRFTELDWHWHELPVQHDIDLPEDLDHLPADVWPGPQP